jgi:predicted Zn-dependent protease
MVKNVGTKITQAVTQFLKSGGQSQRIEGFKWEYNLVNDKTVNAWCMPGGKVVVYSGILPLTQDETGLAVVLGHEIAHAVARHGNERMSEQLLIMMGGIGLAVALSQKPQETQNVFLMCYGVGGTLGSLAYSRIHEYEADKLGLIFMAMAGYNPEKAVDFWQRMAAQGKTNIPQFLSTHPSDENRIKELRAFLPKAKQYYKG